MTKKFITGGRIAIMTFNGGSEGVLIGTNKEGVVMAYQDREDALAKLSAPYKDAHLVSRTASTGAMLHWIQYDMRVHELDIEELKRLAPGKRNLIHCWAEGGGMYGVTTEMTKEFHQSGQLVALV